MRLLFALAVAGFAAAAGAAGLEPWKAGPAPALELQDLQARTHRLADYRGKVVLEEPPGNLAIRDAKVEAARKRLFGNWEMNWLAYNMGHDIALPNSRGPKQPYLMYPNGETSGERLDQLDPDAFRYTISARELPA